MKIPMEKIISTPDRDQGDITSLANSIQQVGLLQPIILKENMDGTYTVVDGRRRFAAMQKLGMEVLQDSQFAFHNSGRIDVLSHVANTERKQLTAAEEVRHLDQLYKAHSIDYLQAILGRTPGWISRRLKIVSLIPEWLKVLDDPELAPLWTLDKLALIARQSEDTQKALLFMTNRNPQPQSFSTEIITNRISRYNRMLSSAVFDTAACLHCKDNSAVHELLFDDMDTGATCTNTTCWVHKSLEVVKAALKSEQLIPISGNGAWCDREDRRYAEKIAARFEWEFAAVRRPKKGETVNAIIVSGDEIGTRVVAVKKSTSESQSGGPQKEKKPASLKERLDQLNRKRVKHALGLLRETFKDKAFVPAFLTREPGEEIDLHFLLCLARWGYRPDRYEFGCKLKTAEANVLIKSPDPGQFYSEQFYPHIADRISEELRLELTKILAAINLEAGPALCKLFRLDWQHDYMDRAIIAIPEPKSLTEARKAAAKDGNTKGGK